MKSLLTVSILTLLSCAAFAQSFRYSVDLATPEKDAFFQIYLPPELIAGSARGLADLRLLDGEGQPVAYFIRTDDASVAENHFLNFPITEIKNEKDSLTHFVANNIANAPVNELLLRIANTSANRTITVSGSNDSSRWYVIAENVSVERNARQGTDFTQVVSLAETNYKWYDITINGRELLPVQILAAGIINKQLKPADFVQLPNPVTSANTRGGTTTVVVNFREKQQVDQIKLDVAAPRFYQREARIYGGKNTSDLLTSFILSSASPAGIHVDHKGSLLRIEIENGDNPPLEISSVTAHQLKKYMLAYLQSGEKYRLVFGDSSARRPSYDLALFADSVKERIDTLAIAGSVALTVPAQRAGSAGISPVIVWVTTGLILLVLLIITWKMLLEVRKAS